MHNDIKVNQAQDINGHILFVDDEENILEIAVEFFQHKGYSVITAMNGVEALKFMQYRKNSLLFYRYQHAGNGWTATGGRNQKN